MRSIGFLLSVQAIDGSGRPLYATVAESYEKARVQVFNHCCLTAEVIRLERLLGEMEVKRIGLQSGQVKLYAT
jgi:hypothetical protein